VKAARFDYERPESLNEAVGLLQESNRSAKALAGGQSLVPMMNLGLAEPDLIVDLNGIPDLKRVEEEGDHLFVGAAITHAAIEDGKLPDTTLGMLRRVAAGIASRGIRNRGTVGGSLAHADPAADWSAALLALGAEARVIGASGRRAVALSDFFLGVFTTALRPDELLEGIMVPRLSRRARWYHYKIHRTASAFAEAIGAVVVDPERNFCRAVLSGAKYIPLNLPVLAKHLSGTDGVDFASKFDLGQAIEVVTQGGFGGDPIEAQVYATVLCRAVKGALAK
jgi:aerobic carbon-monoxide dehydrogenase medium subunit